MEGLNYQEHNVLYVDDEREDRKYFINECGEKFHVLCAEDMHQADSIIESQKICVLICDNRMPMYVGGPVEQHSGLFFLRKIRQTHPHILRALVTGIPKEYRFIPFELMNEAGVEKWIDKLENPSWNVVVKELLEKHISENLVGCSPGGRSFDWFPGVVGASSTMQELINQIEQVCDSGLTKPILIVGESGVGKELAAKAIHNRGNRKDMPYHVFSKAEISGDMARAALFGYARGAFTGAYADTSGAFEMADKGTLFIDDVQNLSWDVQSDLLRVLESGEFRRLGAGEKERKADFQLICSINEDPERLVNRGKLRYDFYYRISSMIIRVPPLRERKESIPALVKEFINDFNNEANHQIGGVKPKCISGIESAALQVLLAHHWRKNNVRELKNIVLSAWINASRNVITKEDLTGRMCLFHRLCAEEFSQEDTPWNIVIKYMNKILEREQINAVLWANILSGGSIREAALLLGIADNPDSGRVRLHSFIKKLNLQDLIDQKSKEILYDCHIKAEGDYQEAAEILSQKLSEIFPYIPEPDVSARQFDQLIRKFRLTM